MAHALDFSTGRAGIAYIGETPWHGLGQQLTPGAPLEFWQQEAGLDWQCKRAGVDFDRMIVDTDGTERPLRSKAKEYVVLYRSDTGDVLHVASTLYQPVQPKEVIEFYRDLTEQYGFELETAGSLKGGRRIWALANTKNAFQLRDKDEQRLYLLLATSFDGSMATQARLTSVRVVCNNTIELATQGRADITISHRSKFDADQVKTALNIGEAWEKYQVAAKAMSERLVSKKESAEFLLDVYFGIDSEEKRAAAAADEKTTAQVEKFTARIQQALFESPGAHLASARGTLWGVVNAVTRDADFLKPARSQENRLNSAWFGPGAALKNRAWQKALRMVA